MFEFGKHVENFDVSITCCYSWYGQALLGALLNKPFAQGATIIKRVDVLQLKSVLTRTTVTWDFVI